MTPHQKYLFQTQSGVYPIFLHCSGSVPDSPCDIPDSSAEIPAQNYYAHAALIPETILP
jgi:hypothetical protein